MIIKNEKMEKQSRNELKGGKGTISFLNFADCTAFKNCRLISEMTIPVNASIASLDTATLTSPVRLEMKVAVSSSVHPRKSWV